MELKGTLAPNGLSVVIAANDQDGFLHTLIGGQDAAIPIPLAIQWSSRTGLSFGGGAGFTFSQSANLGLGPVTIKELRLAFRTTADNTHPPDLIVETGVSIAASIGPVAVSISNVGLHLTVTFKDGNAGPFDIDVGFMPPDGAGLVVDGAGVTGGGFLKHDDGKHEYSGVLQLQFINLALQAFGLITTQVAGGAGYSLLALVDAEFPPVQLGWGFHARWRGRAAGGASHRLDRRAARRAQGGAAFVDPVSEERDHQRAGDPGPARYAVPDGARTLPVRPDGTDRLGHAAHAQGVDRGGRSSCPSR